MLVRSQASSSTTYILDSLQIDIASATFFSPSSQIVFQSAVLYLSFQIRKSQLRN